MDSLRFYIIIIVLLATIPVAGLSTYNYIQQRHLGMLHSQEELQRLVKQGEAGYRQVIQRTRQFLSTLAKFSAVFQRHPAASNFFAELLKEDLLYGNIFASAPHGQMFASALPPVGPSNLSNQKYFQRSIQTKEFTLGEMVIDHTLGKAVLHCAYPVLDRSGQVQAVVVAVITLDRLSDIIPFLELPAGSAFAIIDNQGKILFRHPDPEKWVGKDFAGVEIVKTVLGQKQGLATALGIDGVSRLYAFMPLGQTSQEGFIYCGIPIQTVYGPMNQALINNLLSLLATVIYTLILAWIFLYCVYGNREGDHL